LDGGDVAIASSTPFRFRVVEEVTCQLMALLFDIVFPIAGQEF
jgi:hypothetical protein